MSNGRPEQPKQVPLEIVVTALGSQVDCKSNGSPKMTVLALTLAIQALINKYDMKEPSLIQPVAPIVPVKPN